ncbi:MAG TPA: DUF3168 domain-containing protein [Alloacidobacterium sp.]|nr:DUF3168 domain-containing protein [Alloacidobacterium sp.]
MIDQGLVSILAADAGVTALLATGDARSIFQMVVPEDESAYPCIGYQFVGGSSAPTFDTSGLQRSRVQIDCWAVTPEGAKNLAEAVRKALNGFHGYLSDGTVLSNAMMLHPGIDFFSADSRFFRRMLEFYLLYTFNS